MCATNGPKCSKPKPDVAAAENAERRMRTAGDPLPAALHPATPASLPRLPRGTLRTELQMAPSFLKVLLNITKYRIIDSAFHLKIVLKYTFNTVIKIKHFETIIALAFKTD